MVVYLCKWLAFPEQTSNFVQYIIVVIYGVNTMFLVLSALGPRTHIHSLITIIKTLSEMLIGILVICIIDLIMELLTLVKSEGR